MPYPKVGPFVNGAAPALSAANLDRIETQNELAEAEITRELFVPIFGGTDILFQGALVNGGGDEAFLSLLIPRDFTAITDLEIIFLTQDTQADEHYDITTYYASYLGGEAFNVHTEVDAGRDIGAVLPNRHKAHSIADLVDIAAIVAGDLLLVLIEYSAVVQDSKAYVEGIRLRYT